MKTNAKKIQMLIQFQNRSRELYEEKFNKTDWENKNPQAIKHYNKCKKQAISEIFDVK